MLEQIFSYLFCGWAFFRSGQRIKGFLFFTSFLSALALSGHYLWHGESVRETAIAGAALVLAGLIWLYHFLELREGQKDWANAGVEESPDESPSSGTRRSLGKRGPSEADELYARGRIAYLRGSLDEAKSCFEQLLRSERADSDAAFQLGRIYKQKGENRMAERLFRQCRQLPGGGKWAEEIKKYLEDNKS